MKPTSNNAKKLTCESHFGAPVCFAFCGMNRVVSALFAGLDKGEFVWQMQVPDDVREFCTALPPKLIGDTDLGPDPGNFMKGLVSAIEQKKIGQHVGLFA